MAGDIPVTSGETEKRLLRLIQSLNGGHNSMQKEHASDRTPVSQTPSSSAFETVATYIANLWSPTTSTVPQIAIVTRTPQIITTQQTKICASQQQSFPHVFGTGTWIPHTI
ncbi:unnamed protein product [Lactuca saligna]|uniref:Uncharacterized protein n=1 Tax=Lactuca saligna TaxID=75948 RepID=A0AA35Z0Y8_LACSI|nr:unnamed protein product [Lactuca saligna]